MNLKKINMKTEKEIKRLSKKYFDSEFYDEGDYNQDPYFEGYKKCQKDMTRLLKQCIIRFAALRWWGFKAQMFNPQLMFNRNTNDEFTTSAPLLQNRCYA